jgi:hypothetical protein
MNSGQSHKLAVGSTVRPYTTAAMAKVSHAMRVFSFEKLFCCIMLCKWFTTAKLTTIIKRWGKNCLTFV